MGLFKTKQEKEQKKREETEVRQKNLLESLNEFKHIGVLHNYHLEAKDFDFLYENGWELISHAMSEWDVGSYDEHYFKKFKEDY